MTQPVNMRMEPLGRASHFRYLIPPPMTPLSVSFLSVQNRVWKLASLAGVKSSSITDYIFPVLSTILPVRTGFVSSILAIFVIIKKLEFGSQIWAECSLNIPLW